MAAKRSCVPLPNYAPGMVPTPLITTPLQSQQIEGIQQPPQRMQLILEPVASISILSLEKDVSYQ